MTRDLPENTVYGVIIYVRPYKSLTSSFHASFRSYRTSDAPANNLIFMLLHLKTFQATLN